MTARLCACLGLLLTACTDLPSIAVHNVNHEALYSPQLVRWVASPGRDVVLRVAAPGGRHEQWNAAVEGALAGIAWLPFSDVTATPDGSQRRNFHLGVMVGAPRTAKGDDACRGDAADDTLGAVDGRTHIIVALCTRERPIGSARAVTAAIASPEDGALARAVVAGAIQALPAHDPDRPDQLEEILIP